jgi:hypothetical protein
LAQLIEAGRFISEQLERNSGSRVANAHAAKQARRPAIGA